MSGAHCFARFVIPLMSAACFPPSVVILHYRGMKVCYNLFVLQIVNALFDSSEQLHNATKKRKHYKFAEANNKENDILHADAGNR